MPKRPDPFPFHPLFLAVFPIVALLAENIEQLNYDDAFRPMFAALVGTGVLILILKPPLKSWHKAAGVSSLFLIFFFSYGHVYALIKSTTIANFALGRHRYLAPLWLMGFALSALIFNRKLGDLRAITKLLNQIAILVLVFPVLQLGVFFYHNQVRGFLQPVEVNGPGLQIHVSEDTTLPDIYYIILDGHARADVLQSRFDHDNASFVNFLTDRGFIVADQSNSNYLWTHLALSSSLNLDYLQEMNLNEKPGTFRNKINDLVTHNLVRLSLESVGYTTVSMTSGFAASEFHDADYFLPLDMSRFDQLGVVTGINEFERLLLFTSAVKIFMDYEILQTAAWASEQLNYPFSAHRQAILSAFENLRWVPTLASPKFVYVHIISPHRPYVFDMAGNEVTSREPFLYAPPDLERDEEVSLYRDQITYIDSQLEEIVETILARSETRPIIILQSDHGSIIGFDWKEPEKQAVLDRAAILNAYYLPEECSSSIYATITPVNSFRVIFDCIFGTSYGLLEDITYFDDAKSKPTFTRLEELFP